MAQPDKRIGDAIRVILLVDEHGFREYMEEEAEMLAWGETAVRLEQEMRGYCSKELVLSIDSSPRELGEYRTYVGKKGHIRHGLRSMECVNIEFYVKGYTMQRRARSLTPTRRVDIETEKIPRISLGVRASCDEKKTHIFELISIGSFDSASGTFKVSLSELYSTYDVFRRYRELGLEIDDLLKLAKETMKHGDRAVASALEAVASALKGLAGKIENIEQRGYSLIEPVINREERESFIERTVGLFMEAKRVVASGNIERLTEILNTQIVLGTYSAPLIDLILDYYNYLEVSAGRPRPDSPELLTGDAEDSIRYMRKLDICRLVHAAALAAGFREA